MATTEATLYEIKQGAAWITLNRPENRNALSSILVTELYDHIMAANADDAVRSIVITAQAQLFVPALILKVPRGTSRKALIVPSLMPMC